MKNTCVNEYGKELCYFRAKHSKKIRTWATSTGTKTIKHIQGLASNTDKGGRAKSSRKTQTEGIIFE